MQDFYILFVRGCLYCLLGKFEKPTSFFLLLLTLFYMGMHLHLISVQRWWIFFLFLSKQHAKHWRSFPLPLCILCKRVWIVYRIQRAFGKVYVFNSCWTCKEKTDLSSLKIIPVKSHVASHIKHDLKMFSPSGHVWTIYVLEGVPWKELNSGRSHFSFKFDFQSENELLFFNLNFERFQWRAFRTLCSDCVLRSWGSPSL